MIVRLLIPRHCANSSCVKECFFRRFRKELPEPVYCYQRTGREVRYTLAGPEISVATTKAYSAQLAAMYCLAVQFAKVREKITEEQYSYYISELLTLPEKMQKTLEDKERIQWFAAKYANAHDVFFVGRGIDYAVCLEGSLKLKEISYIHLELEKKLDEQIRQMESTHPGYDEYLCQICRNNL